MKVSWNWFKIFLARKAQTIMIPIYTIYYHTVLYCYITSYVGTKLIDTTASNSLTMPDNYAADILALRCITDDKISLEKASKCSISCHYQDKRRTIQTSKVADIQKQHIPSSGNEIIQYTSIRIRMKVCIFSWKVETSLTVYTFIEFWKMVR